MLARNERRTLRQQEHVLTTELVGSPHYLSTLQQPSSWTNTIFTLFSAPVRYYTPRHPLTED